MVSSYLADPRSRYPFLRMAAQKLWNANIHYHPLLLEAIPPQTTCVLDIGCGDGVLCAQLVQAGVRRVVGIDADAGVLERARSRHSGLPIEWVHGDIFDPSLLSVGAFDAVLSVATLHHMDAAEGLTRLAQLVRPGGILGVLGLAASDWWDLPYTAIGLGARCALSLVHGYWEHSAPTVWPPPVTYRQMKRIARLVLPNVRYRRHLLGRYSLLWKKPW
jgi:SAM-dependent methyltransferase